MGRLKVGYLDRGRHLYVPVPFVQGYEQQEGGVSGLFAAMTAPQIATKYPEYYKLVMEGKMDEANAKLGEMTLLGERSGLE